MRSSGASHPPQGDDRAARSSSIQQEAVAPENPRGQHGLRPRGRGGTGCTQTSPTTDGLRRAAPTPRRSTCTTTRCLCRCSNGSSGPACADLSRIGDDVVLLDPAVSGVGEERTAPPRPLPVRPSHPAGGDGRRRGSSPCGVHAAVPVLLQLRRRTARHHNDRARQRRAGRLRRRGRRTVVRSRVDPPRIPRRRERGSTLSRRPGLPRCCDRHSRRRQRAR